MYWNTSSLARHVGTNTLPPEALAFYRSSMKLQPNAQSDLGWMVVTR
jgi:hypothetical protein